MALASKHIEFCSKYPLGRYPILPYNFKIRILKKHTLLNTETVAAEFKKSLNITLQSPQINKTFAFEFHWFHDEHFYHFNISKVGMHLTIAGVLQLLSVWSEAKCFQDLPFLLPVSWRHYQLGTLNKILCLRLFGTVLKNQTAILYSHRHFFFQHPTQCQTDKQTSLLSLFVW